ncbi:hypothetical protein Bbelb_007840 [Branchiostoma belcheri]|nr:hypothetical protein Bbelb_007840 [Branchiostoma belcheri]
MCLQKPSVGETYVDEAIIANAVCQYLFVKRAHLGKPRGFGDRINALYEHCGLGCTEVQFNGHAAHLQHLSVCTIHLSYGESGIAGRKMMSCVGDTKLSGAAESQAVFDHGLMYPEPGYIQNYDQTRLWIAYVYPESCYIHD